jgi:large subunit ribosomal protein L33
MSQDNLIKLQCTETGRIGYYTRKNKKKNPEKLELKKFNPELRRHTIHREMKK